jgi:hypothetical protein
MKIVAFLTRLGVLYFALLAFVFGLWPESWTISAQHDNECSLSGGFQYKQYVGEKNIQKPYPLGIDCDFLRGAVGCL